MAHTQGPWTAHKQQNKFGTVEGYYVVENGRVQIADLFGIVKGERDEDGNEVFISTDESAANARLIAAAPDLLDALSGDHGDRLNFVASLLMEARNLPLPNGVDWDAWAVTLDEADLFVKEARAAIAKAEGGA